MNKISDIKKEMTDSFISNPDVIAKYGLDSSKSFDEQFSKVSIESILFYIFATAQWVMEQLFESHKKETNAILDERRPHLSKWYAVKAKQFQLGTPLPKFDDEIGEYDNTNKTAGQIESERIVKFAAAVESADKSILYLKIATESSGKKTPITETQRIAFKNYINRVSDAGVRIQIINEKADQMRLVLDIYYDPLIFGSNGKRLNDGSEPVQEAIRNYLSNLPFSGEYMNIALSEVLRNVEGVIIPELLLVKTKYGEFAEWRDVNARAIAYAGYYECSNENLLIAWIPYEASL